jgi:hypothetical protein
VVSELLAGSATRRPRNADEHIPRRTRQAIRQRLVARGLLRERFVPDPAALGCPVVTIALGEPYAEMRSQAVAIWQSLVAGVDVWAFKETIFGVFFSAGQREATALRNELSRPLLHRNVVFLECDARQPTVPVFLDFEASWARITGLQGTLAYPHPLPYRTVSGAARQSLTHGADSEALRSLLSRHFFPGPEPGSTGWTSRLRQRHRERRLLNEGAVQFRSFLNPAACSQWATGFPGGVAFLRGRLVNRRLPDELFRTLVEDCTVSPFFFATDGVSVVFGCLSRNTREYAGADALPRRNLIFELKKFLSQIVVVREPLDALVPVVDHQYDRPFTSQTRD